MIKDARLVTFTTKKQRKPLGNQTTWRIGKQRKKIRSGELARIRLDLIGNAITKNRYSRNRDKENGRSIKSRKRWKLLEYLKKNTMDTGNNAKPQTDIVGGRKRNVGRLDRFRRYEIGCGMRKNWRPPQGRNR